MIFSADTLDNLGRRLIEKKNHGLAFVKMCISEHGLAISPASYTLDIKQIDRLLAQQSFKGGIINFMLFEHTLEMRVSYITNKKNKEFHLSFFWKGVYPDLFILSSIINMLDKLVESWIELKSQSNKNIAHILCVEDLKCQYSKP